VPSTQTLLYLMAGIVVLFIGIIIAYLILRKKMQSSEYAQIKKLQEGTKASSFSLDIFYQKMYLIFIKTPFLKRYILKVRRRLEILHVDDEYTTRKDAARIMANTLLVVIPLAIVTIAITHTNMLLMSILLIFELFMIDTFIDGRVDKIDNNLLREQLDFFAEIRHAYHEYNMVEEAIYQVSLDDEKSVSKQGEKIYEILIADDPETKLEKYYDTAPNSYLKEFAGISYLTKEFGDREDHGTSLYLKNINNITQEMQLEILKRDKLNYVFQSLSLIAIVPVLLLEPLKSWCISNFSFTQKFYLGKGGMIAQILIVLLTVVSYLITRKLKDNGSTSIDTSSENPWQAKVYKRLKMAIDLFIPRVGTRDYKKMQGLLKDAASKQKMEWVYVNRIALSIVTFVVSLILIVSLHNVAIHYVYTEPTTDYNLMGELPEKDLKKAEELTLQDNYFIDKFKGKTGVTQEDIEEEMLRTDYFLEAKEGELEKAAERVLGKLAIVNSETFRWFELLLSMVFALIAYMSPVWLLYFQKKIREMEMEDEVLQFQTIILMLMKLERVNVEMILEWLERYSNIFKEPISRCVNDYEAGGWEALEELKNSVSFIKFIRIVESLQAAVEKIPIIEAFDELDTDRDYYQERRKETNNRLISRKGMIGKVIGFAPMVCLFVGYLIIPLVIIGITSMNDSFSSLG
jgi:hypothetical protein